MKLILRRTTYARATFATAVLAIASLHDVARAECSLPTVDSSIKMNSTGEFQPPQNVMPTATESGDASFSGTNRACNADWVSDLEGHYDIDRGTWGSGKGLTTPCDSDRMYGRFLIGLWVLNWSDPSPATSWDDESGLALHRAGNYAAHDLVDITGICGYNGSLDALTQVDLSGTNLGDEWTKIYKLGAYATTPVGRAAVIYHESRHYTVGHDGNDGSNPCVERGPSCDEYYSDNQDAAGANSYEVHFLWDYTYRGVGRNFGSGTTATAIYSQRASAQRAGNYILANRFDNRSSAAWRISGSRTDGQGWCSLGPGCPTVVL